MAAEAALTPEQTRALFDILTHHETYAEIEGFKYPDAVTGYGYPFRSVTRIPPGGGGKSASSTPFHTAPNTPRSKSPIPPEDGGGGGSSSKGDGTQGGDNGDAGADDETPDTSTSPVLQTLFTRLVLPLPWLRDLPRDFWAVRVQGLLVRLAEADLSESYDKGALGLRKTLATLASSVVEMVGRGALGGVRKDKETRSREYDHGKAEDLERAWDDFVQDLVHGELMDEMFEYAPKSSDLEGHSTTMKGAAEYAIIHLATFMHHIFVISPEGQYLLQLLQNLHGLIPYKTIKQTLRIGNAATMINGMIRLLLAKLSVGGITNWIGLTTNADDGMNLLQRIISLILSWDAAEFRKSAERVEKEKGEDKIDDETLQTLRTFVNVEARLRHEAARSMSLNQSQSIVTAMLNASGSEMSAASLSEKQHLQCLEYCSAVLSVHDRDALTDVMCRQQPDLFTQMIRELVNSYEPFIRMVHQGVDLREYLEAVQGFIDDFIKASRPKKAGKGETRPPSVEDYVELLMKNRHILYRWVHAVASSCPEVWKELRDWAVRSMAHFRKPIESSQGEESNTEAKGKDDTTGAGRSVVVESKLNDLFASLPEGTKASVLGAIDSHATYLSKLEKQSRAQLQHLLDSTHEPGSKSDSQVGPGMYLARWQRLLDETPITPDLPVGPIRKGKDVKHTLAMGKTDIVGDKAAVAVAAEKPVNHGPAPPDVGVVVKELGPGFAAVLQQGFKNKRSNE